MAQLGSPVSRQRTERRISVHLPMTIRGRDRRGLLFEESTSSENLCRSGAAFRTRFELMPGTNVEIQIPFAQYASRRTEADFATQGRVVHVSEEQSEGERLVGVQFVGPRFHRVFQSEAGL